MVHIAHFHYLILLIIELLFFIEFKNFLDSITFHQKLYLQKNLKNLTIFYN